MKPLHKFIPYLLPFTFFLFSCGGGAGNDPIVPTGPNFSVSELTSIRVDQLKITGGLAFDQDGIPNRALYIRCADDQTVDIACAGAEQGLDIIKKDGLTYGRLDAAFVPVEGAAKDKCYNVTLLFVEKGYLDCPSGISGDDTIVWTSGTLTLDEDGEGTLLNKVIANEDKTVMAYLISQTDILKDTLSETAGQQAETNVKLDVLYFTAPTITSDDAIFTLTVASDDDTVDCDATFTGNASGVVKEGIIYGGLGIELQDKNVAGAKCAVTADNKDKDIIVTLSNSIDETVLRTEKKQFKLLVDNDETFQKFGDMGYVRFVPITAVP